MSVCLSVVVILGTFLAAVLGLIALVLPEWVEMSLKGMDFQVGLLQVCVRTIAATICRPLVSSDHEVSLPSLLTLCTSGMGVAFIMNVVSVVCALIFACRTYKALRLITAVIVCSALAGLCGLIAFALWVGKWRSYQSQLNMLSSSSLYRLHIQYMGPAVWMALVMSLLSVINAGLAGGLRNRTAPDSPFAYTEQQPAYPGVIVHGSTIQAELGHYPQEPIAVASTYPTDGKPQVQANNPAIPVHVVSSPDYKY